MLPLMVRRLLWRHGWEKVTYKGLLQAPLAKLVSSQIALAVQDRATRITWGLPPGVQLGEADRADILAYYEAMMRTGDMGLEESREKSGGQPAPSLEQRGAVTFHRRDGLPEVPVWQMGDGQWSRPGPGLLAALFAYLPQHLCERLVSLGKRPLEGGKEEWIEYASLAGEGDRRFIRVDLVLEANNSVTVELLESREQTDAAVWWRHWRV